MKQYIVAGLIIVASLFLSTTRSLAEDAPQGQAWNRHQGYYAELNGGTNFVYLGIFSSDAETSNSGCYGWAWNATIGYSFSAINALEAGFMQNYAIYRDEDINMDVTTHTNIYYLAWRGSAPIGKRAAFFGKIGLMIFSIPDIPDRHWLTLPYTGLGLRYAVTPKVDISVQYQGAFYIIAGAGALTGGITYHF